ncbi:MAG TPA: histidinol-phosphatase [Iamia sp.]|nr:histidinol-phosphatase [Iamia sp.]
MIDYHLHVWPHARGTPPPTADVLAGYVARAAARGIERIAITEHSHRFVQVDAVARGFWTGAESRLAAATAAVWQEEQGADLDAYCEAIQAAQRDGMPIELGIEVDLLPGRASAMAEVIAGYPFDVRLGSVHWLGAWLFDAYGTDAFVAEWGRRGHERAWTEYAEALAELAGSGLCDVVAHCDVVKVAGRLPDPGHRRAIEDRLVDVLAGSGLDVEVSSAGWRKLAAEQYPSRRLLEALHRAGVAITLGSDAHVEEQVGWEYERLLALVGEVGYDQVVTYAGGTRALVDLSP